MNPEQLKRLSKIVLSLTLKVKCPICLNHIENTVELQCSHRFCNTCLSELRLQQPVLCPLCKTPIGKRAPIYKDQFSDELSKFTNHVCQLIKEKYAIGVEEICSEKTDLRKIIETSPKDIFVPKCNKLKTDSSDIKKLQGKNLNFDSDNTLTKISNWLNSNQEKWNNLTQHHTQNEFVGEDEEDFQMPSVSQVQPSKRSKKCTRQRSQSLTVYPELSEPLLKKYQSLNEGLNDADNYNIEEIHSETIVKQVERKVIQDMLEDAYLENLDQLAQNKPKQRNKSFQTKNNKILENKNSFIVNSNSSSGWERIKDVKNTLKKSSKRPKKLNIILQDTNDSNKKKSPKKKAKEIAIKNRNSSESNINKGKEITASKEEKSNNLIYRLSDVENYFDKHMENIQITPQTKISNDSILQINEEEIFLLPTQLTPHNAAKQKHQLHFVPPSIPDIRDADKISLNLNSQLKACLESAAKFDNDIGPTLVTCFTNLLSYAEKLRPVLRENKQTQTESMNNSKLAVKCDKKLVGNVAVQTDVLDFVEKSIQTSGQDGKLFKKRAVSSPLSEKGNISSGTTNNCIKSKRKLNFDKKKDSSQIISSKSSEASKSSKKLHISDVESKENRSSNSVLMCTLDSIKKINPKSTFDESQNRKFKRIRMPTSDSESDEENPCKRKFVKDDLSVEFIDSEKPVKENLTPENQKKRDEFIFEMISRYVPSSPEKDSSVPKKDETEKNKLSGKSEHVFTANAEFEDNLEKFDKEILMIDNNNKKSQNLRKDKTQKDGEEHVFTGDAAFEENLDKFDNEIFEFEKNSKTFNTELDLVENTPQVSSKPKKPRMSNTKNQPLQILSKGSACSGPNKLQNDQYELDSNNMLDMEPSTLNTHIKKLPLDTKKCTDDVSILLNDLEHGDFFTNNVNYEENDPFAIANSAKENNKTQKKLSYDLGNLFDDDIEEQLQNMELTNVQKQTEENRINILQNITLKSPGKPENNKFEAENVIDSTDDEEFIETTPKKKKNSSLDRPSTEAILKNLENNLEEMDVYLPPPPGFEDDAAETNKSPEILDSLVKQNKTSSVTQEGLTEFIITPDEMPHKSHIPKTQQQSSTCEPIQSQKIQQSLTFKGTMLPPTRPSLREKTISDSEGIFSPATKCSIRITQPKYTPLISTPRSAEKKPILMTSTPKQKSILNYAISSQEMSQKSKPCIMWSRIINKDVDVFAQLETKNLATTSKVFSPSVTHLVVMVDKMGQILSHTVKILQAIAAGLWVVRYEWAEDCLKMNKIVHEELYEALDVTGASGPKNSRLTRGSKTLFKGFKFYCAPPLKTIIKKDLETILQLTGGEITKDLGSMLNDDGKIRIILTESSATEDTDQFETWFEIYKSVTVDVEWLSCCIGQYKLISFRPFLVAGDEAVIFDLGYPANLVETVPFTLSEQM